MMHYPFIKDVIEEPCVLAGGAAPELENGSALKFLLKLYPGENNLRFGFLLSHLKPLLPYC